MSVSSRPVLRQGFTLIEMSMVLLIIGLIIGGIMGGQEMVNAAKIQRLGKEAYEIRDAAMLFQDKYQSLPGDIPNATRLWGNSGCNNSVTTNPCDGNSDGRVWTNFSYAGTANGQEQLRFWHHLNLAQMFPGQYTGLFGTPGVFQGGVNVPWTPLDGIAFQVAWSVAFTTSCGPNCFNRGAYTAIQNQIRVEGTTGISSITSKTIDTKLDDGIAYSGRVIAFSLAASQSCPFWETLTPTDYDTTNNAKQCLMRFNIIDTQRGAT